MSEQPPPKKPWPMKWVVAAIFVFIAVYTYLTLHFRRPGQAYEPFAEGRSRVTVERLLNAGYRRITLAAVRPTEPLRTAAPAQIATATGGLPPILEKSLVEAPLLPTTVARVTAAREMSATETYSIDFTAALPDEKEDLLDAQVYVRKGELVFVPNFERVPDGLLVRSPETVVRLTVPADVLAPGRYRVTLVALRESLTWELTVK